MLLDNFLNASILFQVTAFLYFAGFLLFTIALWRKNKSLRTAATVILTFAFAANTGVIGERWISADRPPFKTLYETLVFYPWCVSAVFFVLLAAYKLYAFGMFASAISLSGFAYAAYRPDLEIVNLPPALQSGWFVPHVITYFIAYAALFASFSLAVLYLGRPIWKKGELEVNFEKLSNHTLDFGFAALTLGLVMGAFWGKVAWGNYWSWDPKENWALVTWLTYLVIIHLRFVRGWKGRKAAILMIIGFGTVVFTYLGMSLLPSADSSLHVYQ
jgi:ABC-type transport system involved in cytochrome c biogenesis permease subunit